MNILIPMAGLGSRFRLAGYELPKPLIDINGKPMIQRVIENINIDANYIFIVQEEHIQKYNLEKILKDSTINPTIITINKTTEGAACTTLLAKKEINDENLLIVNSDQIIDFHENNSLKTLNEYASDGVIVTIYSDDKACSFVKEDNNCNVIEVAEKKIISNKATVGMYFWKNGRDYVKYAEQMISKNIRTNNEFYVCPVYNEAILDNKIIKTLQAKKMWNIGTPEGLELYLKTR